MNAHCEGRADVGGAATAPRTRRSLRRKRLGCAIVACLGVVLVVGASLMRVAQDDGRLQSTALAPRPPSMPFV